MSLHVMPAAPPPPGRTQRTEDLVTLEQRLHSVQHRLQTLQGELRDQEAAKLRWPGRERRYHERRRP